MILADAGQRFKVMEQRAWNWNLTANGRETAQLASLQTGDTTAMMQRIDRILGCLNPEAVISGQCPLGTKQLACQVPSLHENIHRFPLLQGRIAAI